MDIPTHLKLEFERLCKAKGLSDEDVYDLWKIIEEIYDSAPSGWHE